MGASGMQGTDAVLVLVAGSDSPWVIDSGLGVSKMTPPCPGAIVFWAQHKWMILRSDLHLMFYVTSEPPLELKAAAMQQFSGFRTELQLLKLKLGLCGNFYVPFPQACPTITVPGDCSLLQT